MNHSLFVEVRERKIDAKLLHMLLTRGKLSDIYIEKGTDTVIFYEVKGRGWRATIRVVITPRRLTEIIKYDSLENSENSAWIDDLDIDTVVTSVDAGCNDMTESCIIEYRYLQIYRTIWLIGVIDISNIDGVDKELLIALNKALLVHDLNPLIRPM